MPGDIEIHSAAREIVASLTEEDGVELEDAAAFLEEIGQVIGAYVAALHAIAQRLRATMPPAGRWRALLTTAAAQGNPVDDDAVAPLAARLTEIVLESAHVAEIFLDDEALRRRLHAPLMQIVSRVSLDLEHAIRDEPPPEAEKRPPRRATLADDGFVFPLFAGPRDDAELDPQEPCKVCNTDASTRFNGACYTCFREGKAPHAVDTEHGVVTPELAAAGKTGGVPESAARPDGLPAEEIVEEENGERQVWLRMRVPASALLELTRTPTYSTWQGESWLFCCRAPMVYVGSGLETLRASMPTDADEALFVAKTLEVDPSVGQRILDDVAAERVSAYVFQCARCSKVRGHWDRD